MSFAAFNWTEGQKIELPGVYANVPIRTYHGDLCVKPSISSGHMRKAENGSLAEVWDEFYLNPDRAPPEDKKSFILGRAAHHLLLGERGFKEEFLLQPDTYEDDRGQEKPWNNNAKSCKSWNAKAALAKKSVITSTDLDNIRGMAEALHNHPMVQQGFLNGQVERSIIYQDETTKLYIKSRPDVLPLSDDTGTDLKTADSVHPDAVQRSISEYGYHQQMALVRAAWMEVSGRKLKDLVLFFIQPRRPFLINVKPLDPDSLWWGARQNRRAIDRIAEAIQSGYWPGYDDDHRQVGLTKRLRDRLVREDEAGELPEIDNNFY